MILTLNKVVNYHYYFMFPSRFRCIKFGESKDFWLFKSFKTLRKFNCLT